MHKSDIQGGIQDIHGRAGDDEAQHIMEDSLRADFIEAIARGTLIGDQRELAKLVLSTDALGFCRWCA
jgi:hypothetical protein